MEKEFVPYELVVKLKALGFDEPCLAYYQKSAVIGDDTILPIQIRNKASNFNDNEYSKMGVPFCSAPTFSQAFRWFREKYDLRIWIESNHGVSKFEYVIATTNHNFIDKQFNDFSSYKTYEEAELECLEKLIEIVEQYKS
jgi:hypothetical protein